MFWLMLKTEFLRRKLRSDGALRANARWNLPAHLLVRRAPLPFQLQGE
jgi:hypothetical protein